MPHTALKLVGGANTAETPAQNENGGIAQTNLIRYVYDPGGLTLVAKLGGWTAYSNFTTPAVTAALWGWEDLNGTAHLAVATEIGPNGIGTSSYLFDLVSGTAPQNITPAQVLYQSDAGGISFNTTAGSSQVAIFDIIVTSILAVGASVNFITQVCVGGLVLFGEYAMVPGSTYYYINATDILGNPVFATSTSSTYILPEFTASLGSNLVTVNMPGYTYAIGDTVAFVVETVIQGSGITIYGNYVVQSIINSTQFTILVPTASLNNNSAFLNQYQVINYVARAYDNYSSVFQQLISATDWTLDNFGEYLVACTVGLANTGIAGWVNGGGIYLWEPGQPRAALIPQAPTINDGIFVAMPQRQIIAWGSTETGIQDPLLISWCDVNNPNQWIPLVTNQAGNYRIPKGSKIVGCIQGPTQGLVWTDIDAWSMQYIGPPLVYSFNEIGTGCGLIARHAAASANGMVWWMGPSQFFTMSSNGVQPLPCPVWDVVFQNLNQSLLGNIRVGVNSLFNEISWFFTAASTGASQNDSYVKYNYLLNLWDYGIGTLGRSAWIDQSVLGPPIGADPVSLQLYQHETSNDAAGSAMNSYFQTGYYALNETDVKSFVDWIKPDAKWGMYTQSQLASLQITFFVADYAGQIPTAYGPYTVTQATEYFYTRFRARLMAIRVGSDDLGSYWRIGQLRYRFALDGKI